MSAPAPPPAAPAAPAASGYLTEDEKLQQQLTGMTPQQRALYTSQRSRYFKGTIAVCVIYAVIALVLFALAISSEKGRELLATDLLPFTVTFIGGMIFVIIALTVQVLNFKPPKYDPSDPNALVCPDYWSLKKTPEHVLENAAAADRYKLQYMCVNDRRDLMGEGAYDAVIPVGTADSPLAVGVKLRDEVAKKSYGATGTAGKLNCNMLYPDLMSAADRAAFPETPHRMRCQYARTCGINWTSACPDLPTADA